MNEIRLNMCSYFAIFHIRLKLIITKYKMLLKCFVLIRCMILLYFLFIFLILFSDQSDLSTFLYVFIIFAILNDYHDTIFFSFLIQETVFFTKLSINCRRYAAYCLISIKKLKCLKIQSILLIFLIVFVFVFFYDLCLIAFLVLTSEQKNVFINL